MYDHGDKKASPAKPAGPAGSVTEAERRTAERHLFTAASEVAELSSGARFASRTTDLASGGCYVDTLVPFPIGSKVQVKVQKNNAEFEARGVVVYSQNGLGMGIAFDALEPAQRTILDRWLNELTGGVPAPNEDALRTFAKPMVDRGREQTAMSRLVEILIAKGMLTDYEGDSILNEPLP